MFTFEINVVCDRCWEYFCSTPLQTPDIEEAKRQAKAKGWFFSEWGAVGPDCIEKAAEKEGA